MRKGKNTPFDEIDQRAKELLAKYNEPKDQAEIYFLLSHIYAQTGLNHPKKAIFYGEKARTLPLDLDKQMRLNTYLGDATLMLSKDFANNRKHALTYYLNGLKEVSRFDLPEQPPNLPPVFKYTADPRDPRYAKLVKEHEAAWKKRNEAEFQRTMILHCDTFTKQIVWTYSRPPLATKELEQAAKQTLNDAALVEKLMAQVRASLEKVDTTQTKAREKSQRPGPSSSLWLRVVCLALIVLFAALAVYYGYRSRKKQT